MFELKSAEELSFKTLRKDSKFEEKLTCGLEIDMRNLAKVSKLGLWWDPFIQSRKCTSLKLTGDLCVMAMKNDAKFEEKLTCQFKINMRNLTNFDQSTWKSQEFAL